MWLAENDPVDGFRGISLHLNAMSLVMQVPAFAPSSLVVWTPIQLRALIGDLHLPVIADVSSRLQGFSHGFLSSENLS